ncbi:MAG: hypothetical protein GY810_28135 [Aureispira sp.]|nr:hypothetical protein [Aureispira sp.]
MNENTHKINQLLASRIQENLDLAIELVNANELQENCYYLYRFGEMLDYLRQFEHIDIIEYKFLAPQVKHIQEIEQKIGKTLDEGVKTFYEQCGGLFLFWLDKRNPRYELAKNSYQQDICVDGSIAIFNLDAIYHSNHLRTYGYERKFRHKTLSAEEIEATHHLFDYLSSYYDMMAYTGEEFSNNPILMMGSDHGGWYEDSRLMHIPAYLELVFHSCGTVDSRPNLCRSNGGNLKPILKPDKAFFDQYPRPDFSNYPYEETHYPLDFWERLE